MDSHNLSMDSLVDGVALTVLRSAPVFSVLKGKKKKGRKGVTAQFSADDLRVLAVGLMKSTSLDHATQHQNRMLQNLWHFQNIRSDEGSDDHSWKSGAELSIGYIRDKTLVSPDVQNCVSVEISNISVSDLSCAGTRGFPSPIDCVRSVQSDFPEHANYQGIIRIDTLAPSENACATKVFEDKSVQTEPLGTNPPITSQHSHLAFIDNITPTRRRRTRPPSSCSGHRNSSRIESRADDAAPVGSEWSVSSSACSSFLQYASMERLPHTQTDLLRPQLSCSRGFRRRRPLPGTRPSPVPHPQAAAGP